MRKSLVVFLSMFSAIVAQAGEIVIATVPKRADPQLSDEAVSLLDQLEEQGKLIKREDTKKIEITYHHEDSPDLFNALKEAGFITHKVSSDSQKTGGGCGDASGAKTTGY